MTKICPLCDSTDIDPQGWKNEKGETGPQCLECGLAAESVDIWNRCHDDSELTEAELESSFDQWELEYRRKNIREFTLQSVKDMEAAFGAGAMAERRKKAIRRRRQ